MSDNRTEHEIREDAAAYARQIVYALQAGDTLTVRVSKSETTSLPNFEFREDDSRGR